MSEREVVILAARRTPIGKFEGGLAGVPAPELGAAAIRAALADAGVDPAAVDEVLMGNVLQAGVGQAPARQAALKAGLPGTVSATTINKVCGSGMKAVMLGAQAIRAGDADLIVAGGMENMYRAPYALPEARGGYRLNNGAIVDLAVHDGLWCALEDWHMGSAAEWVASECGITRPRQDQFALESHQRAVAAIDAGAFRREIVPVEVRDRRGAVTTVDTDEGPRRDTSPEALAKLRPAFDPAGTVTAGNAPGLNHGGAALVIAGRDWAAAHGRAPLARIVGYAQAAVAPKEIFLAPVKGVRALLERTGLAMADFDVVEINEAFAAQVLADGDSIPGWDWSRVNVRGGAIALGHPIGASGARILVTLLHTLADQGGRYGLATACLGGGEAVALAVELL
jgi:acetyl-CoA C-acetyltransferase